MSGLVIRRVAGNLGLAMIIALTAGMTGVGQAQAQWPGSGEVRLPDPVEFANQMELGDVSLATRWLDAGLAPDFIGSRIGSGLMIGAWEGNIELMRLFISRGADINQPNANGESPLALAAWRGHLDAARWLVERGARINGRPRQWSPLHYAVFAGQAAMVDYLLEQGADVDALSTNGSSVLMMAVYEGRGEMVKKLLEKGARRDVRNDWGDGALDWAMRGNRLEIARMVSNPEEFNIAVSQPRESWGEARRSLAMSPELEKLLVMREILVERQQATAAIDQRIAAERVRIVRQQMAQSAPPAAAVVEISASRQGSGRQSIRVIKAPPVARPAPAFKVPPATVHGKPKMPVTVPARNY